MLVVFGGWLIVTTESALMYTAEDDNFNYNEEIGDSSLFGFGSKKENKTNVESSRNRRFGTTTRESEHVTPGWVIKYPITTKRPTHFVGQTNNTEHQGWGIFATTTKTSRIGWNIPTTTKPTTATVSRFWETTKPTKRTTTRNWLNVTRRGPSATTPWTTRNSTNIMGWVKPTTTPRSILPNKNSKMIMGWDIPTAATTPRPLSRINIHSVNNEWRPTRGSLNSNHSTMNSPAWRTPSVTMQPNTITTQRPLSTIKYFPNQSGWDVTTTVRAFNPTMNSSNINMGWYATTPKTPSDWYPTTSRGPPVTMHPTSITTQKSFKTFGEKAARRSSTRRPHIIRTKPTTQNPFGGYSRRNISSPNVGTWNVIAAVNTQIPRPYPSQIGSNWNQWNTNNNQYNPYPGPTYVQTSNVIPHDQSKCCGVLTSPTG